MIFERLPIDREPLVFFPSHSVAAFDLLVKAALGLVAQPLAFEHLEKKRGNLQVAALIAHVLRHVRNYVPKDVEADQIDRPECRGARPAYGLASKRVDLLNSQ